MIEIELTNTESSDQNGRIKFGKNSISIGNHPYCDLYLPHPDLIRDHVIFNIENNKIHLHPNKLINFVIVDGKRTTSAIIFKIGSVLVLGPFNIKLLTFEISEFIPMNKKINEITDKLIQEKSPFLDILKSFNEE